MKSIEINGGNELTGEIIISGAKNSVVALIPACILSDEETTIYNVPNISDTKALGEIIKYLGAKFELNDNTLKIDGSMLQNKTIPEELAKKLRASYYFMGALLGKYKRAEVYFPGGCNIGSRPIDIHLKGFKKLGATIKIDKDKYIIEAKELIGCPIYLDFASVGATINIIFASVLAKGITTISNAAKEPEIVNICTLLNNMGAKITGAGTSEIKIKGVSKLHKASIDVIPDRIEAGTYIIAGCLLGKNLIIKNIIKEHLEALTSKLMEMGADIKIEENNIIINKVVNLKPINIKTLVFPGFPTDLGQPMCTLLTQCKGKSLFEENIYENRFGHVKYLNKMGAKIKIKQKFLTIKGSTKLKGREVVSTDLRGGASLVLAGLIAKGKTTISDVEHILRGYEDIIEKLSACGANIKLIS